VPVGVKQTTKNPATHAELQLQRSVQGSVHMSRTRQSPKVRLIVLKHKLRCRPEMYYCCYYSLTQPLLAMHRYLDSPRARPRQARPYVLLNCTRDCRTALLAMWRIHAAARPSNPCGVVWLRKLIAR
jgi:hypothetical protein